MTSPQEILDTGTKPLPGENTPEVEWDTSCIGKALTVEVVA